MALFSRTVGSLQKFSHSILRFELHSRKALSSSAVLLSDKKAWQVGKLNHVAIAVPDLDKATAFYKDVLGAKVSEKHAQHEHGVYTVFVELGDTKIELLYPMGEKSPIANFLEQNKAGGMHHICIDVSDMKEAMADAKKHNVRTLGTEAKIGAHGKPVIFLHPKDCNGVLTELEEE